MLSTLRIENFAIVERLEIDFDKGLTAFTGETGAGKSILIDALLLALGARADASVVRKGAEKCDISAVFTLDAGSPPHAFLVHHEAAALEEDTLVLRRVINQDGRSKSSINGHPFPLQKVRELSKMIVDIHGQHEHQSLLEHATHRRQLDEYGSHGERLQVLAEHWRRMESMRTTLKQLESQEQSLDARRFLDFQIEELQNLAPVAGEIDALHEEHQLLHHAREYLETTGFLETLLDTGEDEGMTRLLARAQQYVRSLPEANPHIQTISSLLDSARIQCEEALNELRAFSEQVQLDPERLHTVEARMSELHNAARKYHVDAASLPDLLEKLISQRAALDTELAQKDNLEAALHRERQAYEKASLELRESRQLHAPRLAADITHTIQQLGMPRGRVEIRITPTEHPQPHGLDRVEYHVCTNPGTEPDSLSKIASGGELSRISLAIHMITARKGATPTLLFDEVDTGIGGATAALVGRLLRELGERLQVLCVTHQPQVAASAHHHYVVEKHSDSEHTWTSVTRLEKDEKTDEIARMLGGLTITENTRSHARELLGEAG